MIKKTKISLLTIDFGMGGTERFISLLLPKLTKDFEVTLVIFYNYIDFEIPNDVNLIILKPDTKKSKSILFKIKNFYNLYKKYKNLVKKNSIDVSISLLPIPNIINSLVAVKNKNVKTIISERCYPSLMYKENKMQMLLAKLFFPFFYNKNNLLFSNSTHINLDLKENFGVKLPMKVIYNPIDVNDKQKLDINNTINTNILKVINAGTIYSAKNQKLILDAMALSQPGDFKVTILGDGELIENLRLQAKKLNISEFLILKGKVSDVKSHLLQNDCFVLSSNTEGFPNALLEALSVGLPTISTNCMSGPLEMLNDNEPISINTGGFFRAKYGILINVNDKAGLHKALMYLKNNPEERKRYSSLAIKRAKNYSMSKIYDQVKNLINN